MRKNKAAQAASKPKKKSQSGYTPKGPSHGGHPNPTPTAKPTGGKGQAKGRLRTAKQGTPQPNPANAKKAADNWFTNLVAKNPTLAPLALGSGALTLAKILGENSVVRAGGSGSPAGGVGVEPVSPDEGDEGVEPVSPVVAPEGTKPAVNEQGVPRAQVLTTEAQRQAGNVPWGTRVGGEYVSPDFKRDTVHMTDLNGEPNQIAIQQLIDANSRGMPSARQATRDINAQAIDPNSPMSQALRRMGHPMFQGGRAIMYNPPAQAPTQQPAPTPVAPVDEDVSLPQGYANGGYISSRDGMPVKAGRDNRLIAAQDGEFVLSRNAVQMLGLRNLEQLNRMAAGPDANVPTDNGGTYGYADGGEVVDPVERYRAETPSNFATSYGRGNQLPLQGSANITKQQAANYDMGMEFNRQDYISNNPVKHVAVNAPNVFGFADDANRLQKLARSKEGLASIVKGQADISGWKSTGETIANRGKLSVNPSWMEKFGTKVIGKGATKAAKVGGAVAQRGLLLANLYDAVAAPIAELTGRDYTTDNAIANLVDQNENYHSNLHGRSPQYARSMAIAGTTDPSQLKWYHKLGGAAESMANEITGGGYDATVNFFNDGYAARRGVDADPYGGGMLGEKIGNWFFSDNNEEEDKARAAKKAAFIAQLKSQAASKPTGRKAALARRRNS